MEGFLIREDGSEIVRYNAPDFPIRSGFSRLSVFADFAADCHWHEDFEALIPLDGDLDYSINGVRVHLNPGDAVFVNSRRLHFGYLEKREERHYGYVVFPPELLGYLPAAASALERLCRDGSPDYWLFSADKPEDQGVLKRILFLCGHAAPREALAVQSACAALLDEILRRSADGPDRPADPDWALIRAMVGFIQSHYREKIQLDAIAAAGAVCRSRCCRLFRDKLRVSPMQYATRYRLEKACGLMRDGADVTDAAFSSGFQGVSYFSETFRKTYGVSPTAYIRQLKENGTTNEQQKGWENK